MKNYRTKTRLGFAVAALLAGLLGAEVQAGTVIATQTGANPAAGTVTRTIVSGPGAPQTTTLSIERFDVTRTGGTDASILAGTGALNEFLAFCIEPREFITQGQSVTYDLVSLDQAATNLGGIGQAKAYQIEELFGRWAPNLAASAMTSLEASALQIAIWEIVRETAGLALDVFTGNIYFSATGDSPNGVTELAQTYVVSINGTGPRATNLRALTNGTPGSQGSGTQDLLVQVVPEPGSLALFGGGLLCLGFTRRRKAG